ncbi:MAG: ATP-dependent Clp protease adaptor ClpS [Caldilineaceae bacterium]|nr:ATP-dependent Clp protease adaptor ClpS [Caldilineaceae bacterium]
MFTSPVQLTPYTIPDTVIDESTDEQFERMWSVIIHNDDVTPYEYVILILEHIFMLSSEMAEHVTWMAHTNGQAIVVIRPRSEAERLIMAARGRSRMDGFPLTFSMEQE